MSTLLMRVALLVLLDSLCLPPLGAFAQSQVTGDLSQAAPYGIPPDLFNRAVSRTVKRSSIYVPGYNVSAPEGFGPSGNGSAVEGWQLGVAVAGSVPLNDAAAPGINKADVMEATTLWLEAPPGVGRLNATAWKLCATVFPFVNMTAADAVPASSSPARREAGDCGPWVTDQCAAALGMVGLTSGVNDDGDCYDITVPPSCLPYFEKSKGNGTSIPLDGKTLDDGRFYAWGSLPTTRDDAAALADAVRHVWPVLLTWVQFGSSGKVNAANTYVSCVRAGANGTGPATDHGSALSAGTIGDVANCPPAKATWMKAALVSVMLAVFF